MLHEWHYPLKDRPKLSIDNNGELSYNAKEPIQDLITWVYEEGSFAPSAKIVGEERYSIINDYIGRPIQAYNEVGKLIWETDYDIYGQLRNLRGERSFIPFRQLGQYEDVETGLYYNRFRYYNPDSGLYISQDPIGLAGNNPNFYAYVFNSNFEMDLFGLDLHHIIPQEVYKTFNNEFKNVKGYVQNVTKKAMDKSNLIDLDKPFHGNHPKYSDYVNKSVKDLVDNNNLNLKSIRKLQDEMLGHIGDALKSGKNLNDYFKEGLHLKKCK